MTRIFTSIGKTLIIIGIFLAVRPGIGDELDNTGEKPWATFTEGYVTPFETGINQGAGKTVSSRHRGELRRFDIFHIDTLLFGDYDGDGFYSSFDLTFDLDVEYGDALVFADIWIRRYGGYYELLHTTDTFVIEGQNAYDEYYVSTDLLDDFPRDYYDILIELYDVDYSLIVPVAVADSGNNNSLFALPLESRYRYYGGSSVMITASGAGAMASVLPVLLVLAFCRIRNRRKSTQIDANRKKLECTATK